MLETSKIMTGPCDEAQLHGFVLAGSQSVHRNNTNVGKELIISFRFRNSNRSQMRE